MKNKTFFKIYLIYFVSMLCVALVFLLGYLGIVKNSILSTFLIQVMTMFAIPLLMYTLMVSKDTKKTFRDFGFRKISPKMILITILIGFSLYFVNSYIAQMSYTALTLFGYESLSSPVQVNLNYAELLKELIFSAAFPGFFEEFLHRGLLLNAGKKSCRPKVALALSSILFGLMHMNIVQFFYAALLGSLIGLVSIYANSIYPAMIVHFMNNALNSIFFFGNHKNWPISTLVNKIESLLLTNSMLYIVLSSVLLASLVWLYWKLLKKLAQARAEYDIKHIIHAFKQSNISLEETQRLITKKKVLLLSRCYFYIGNNKKSYPKAYIDKIFLISSLVLGVLMTILSFIAGAA